MLGTEEGVEDEGKRDKESMRGVEGERFLRSRERKGSVTDRRKTVRGALVGKGIRGKNEG